jgi:ketosteroid isomerase-like protein
MLVGLNIPGALAAVGQSSPTAYIASEQTKGGDAFAPLREQWAHDLHDKRIDASVAAYAADAEFINPDGSRVKAAKGLRELFETITRTYDSDLVFDSQRIQVSGDLAYDSGSYKEKLLLIASGKRQQASGSYLTIYQRSKDGTWLIAEQVWTGSVTDAPTMAITLDAHPTVALTFDDLPAAGSLPAGQNRTKILTALAAELKALHLEGAYGFVNAVKLENDPDSQQALRVWLDAGMNIGNHTWSHMSLTANTAEAFEHEIALNERALAQYAGTRDWHWFRYPFLWEGARWRRGMPCAPTSSIMAIAPPRFRSTLRTTPGTTPMHAAQPSRTMKPLPGSSKAISILRRSTFAWAARNSTSPSVTRFPT